MKRYMDKSTSKETSLLPSFYKPLKIKKNSMFLLIIKT